MVRPMIEIRLATEADWAEIWPIVHEVFSAADTYVYPPDTDQARAFDLWMATPAVTYVALDAGEVVGTYYLKPNQPGLGSHVCNAGYMVRSTARGRGVGRAMCEHSIPEARRLGFRAMQYNLVVSTNVYAIKLWQDMGFEIVGTLPNAFQHPEKGLVDAHVMYQWLG